MPFAQAGTDDLVSRVRCGWLAFRVLPCYPTSRSVIAICHADHVRQTGEILVQLTIIRTGKADGFQVVGHAGRAINYADLLWRFILTRRFVNHMAHLGEASRLEAVHVTDRLKGSGNHYARR